MAHALVVATAVLALVGIPHGAGAQGVPVPTPKPGTLGGIVTDTMGTPVANADVYLQPLKKQARTRADGTFLFDSVRAGKYDVAARAAGYTVETVTIVVSERGGFVPIRIARTGATLPSVVTTAELGGLSGVIGDTAYQALADVEVHVIGTVSRARTDSLGRFLVPLPAGSYMVELKRQGFWRQMLSVTIPEGSGRRIAAWLAPVSGNDDAQLAANLFEMNQRIMRAIPSRSKVYTREDLAGLPHITELRQLATLTATGFVSDDCEVLVNGGPSKLPIWALQTADVEFVEAYTGKIAVPKTTSLGNAGGRKLETSTSMIPQAGRACGYVALVVWLRQ